jgi:cell wall-associated NlpC family hydrolase
MSEINITPYIGLPYKVREMDCWQLIRKFAKEQLGLYYPDFLYDVDNITPQSATHIETETSLGKRWKKVDEPQLGDVIIFRMRGIACHCGVYISEGNFLHTLKGRESSYESLDSYWKQSVVNIYRWSPDA